MRLTALIIPNINVLYEFLFVKHLFLTFIWFTSLYVFGIWTGLHFKFNLYFYPSNLSLNHHMEAMVSP